MITSMIIHSVSGSTSMIIHSVSGLSEGGGNICYTSASGSSEGGGNIIIYRIAGNFRWSKFRENPVSPPEENFAVLIFAFSTSASY